MQAAEMLCGTRVYRLVFLISLAIGYVHSYPLQILPSIPGYISVYIRHGDEPLEDINPALAEAFHEGPNSLKATNLANVNGPTDISLEEDEANKNNVEAIRVRKAENNSPVADDKDKEITEMAAKEEPLKLETVLDTVEKVGPLTEEQKNSSKKIQTDVKEQAKKFDDMLHRLKLNLPQLSAKQSSKKDNIPTHNSVVKIDPTVVEKLADSNPFLITITDEELPIKELSLPHVLSNVQKVTASPEILHQLEMDRAENQSLEEKSK